MACLHELDVLERALGSLKVCKLLGQDRQRRGYDALSVGISSLLLLFSF